MRCEAKRLTAAADEAAAGSSVEGTVETPPAAELVAPTPMRCEARRLTAAADEAAA